LVDLAAVAFGGAAGAAISVENSEVETFDGWTVIDETFGGAWRAHPFVDQLDHFNDALPLGDTGFDSIANLHGIGRLR
jgi:hypothetical protein